MLLGYMCSNHVSCLIREKYYPPTTQYMGQLTLDWEIADGIAIYLQGVPGRDGLP